MIINGKKIPYLNRGTIFNLMRIIKKPKTVTLYIEQTLNEKKFALICSFDNTGNININTNFITIKENYLKSLKEY